MRKKNVPFFLLYTISGENIQVKKKVSTNIQVELTSLDFLAWYYLDFKYYSARVQIKTYTAKTYIHLWKKYYA